MSIQSHIIKNLHYLNINWTDMFDSCAHILQLVHDTAVYKHDAEVNVIWLIPLPKKFKSHFTNCEVILVDAKAEILFVCYIQDVSQGHV